MRLIHAHIYGFGNWVDTSIDFTGGPFLCLYGGNESGKSTLRQFLMFMLFGFLPKKRTFYQPKSSSRMGGRLTVVTEDLEEFTIERLDQVRNGSAICTRKNGKVEDEVWLRERMNGMTASTYEAIFSFSALDLADIRNMKEEDLGEVLLGIGLTGSSSIHRVEKKLETHLNELFKPSGRKPAINDQLLKLEQGKQTLEQHREMEESYKDKTRRAEKLNQSMAQLQADLKTIAETIRFTEKHEDVLPLLQAYDNDEDQLKGFEETISFPENGIKRFEKLQDKLLPLEGEQAVVDNTITQRQSAIETMHSQQHSDDVIQRAEALLNEKQAEEKRAYTLETIDDRLTKLDVRIRADIQELGIDLSEEDLHKLSLPFGLEKTWQHLKQSQENLNVETTRLNEQHHSITWRKEQIKVDKHQAGEQLLKQSEAVYQQQQLDNAQKADVQAKLTEQQANQSTAWDQIRSVRIKQLTMVLWGALGLAAVALLAGVMSTNAILIVIGIALVVVGTGQYIVGKQSLKTMRNILAVNTERSDDDTMTQKEKATIETTLVQHHQAQMDMKSLEEQERALQLEWHKWEDDYQALDGKIERLEQDVNDEKAVYPFLSGVDVSYWPELFSALRQLLERQKEKEQLFYDQRQLKSDQRDSARLVQRFFEDMFWEMPSYSSEETKQLRSFLDDERSLRSQIIDYRQSLKEDETKRKDLQQRMKIYEAEKEALFAHAGSKDEDTFRQQSEKSREKARLQHEQSNRLQQLANRFPVSQYRYILDEATRDSDSLRERLEALQTQYSDKEASLEDKRSVHSYIRTELENMESDTDLSARMHRLTMDSETLNKSAQKWSVYKIAQNALQEAKRTFREKYIDKVIKQTTAYFTTVTAGLYTSVHPPGKEKAFRVERYDGVRFSVSELSQGTLDQLYVSLRLAIGLIMSAEHHVPYIIDDAFVHFDNKRTKQMLAILQELASDQQILLFTCKENVVQSIKNGKVVRLNETVA